MNIVAFPNLILSQKMPDFDFSNPIMDPKKLEQDMIDFMIKNKGIGLAANQVGIRTRVFVMGHENNPSLAQGFFNPMIVSNTESIEDLAEGCLSFPGIVVKIKRPRAIKARWQNNQGEWMEGTFENYECKCFLHEYDHLEGITFRDRVSSIKWALAEKKSKKRV